MTNILSLAIIGMAFIILLDLGCYFWLRHNHLTRLLPRGRLPPERLRRQAVSASGNWEKTRVAFGSKPLLSDH